jgi:hypothetical protein
MLWKMRRGDVSDESIEKARGCFIKLYIIAGTASQVEGEGNLLCGPASLGAVGA